MKVDELSNTFSAGAAFDVQRKAVLRRIPAKPESGSDLVSALRSTGVGRLYVNHLKQYAVIRAMVIWTWRNLCPLYLRFSFITQARKRRKWRKLVRLSDYLSSCLGSSHTLLESRSIEAPVKFVFPVEQRLLLEKPSSSLAFPRIQVAVLKDAIQYGGTNLVLVGESVICHDLYVFTRDFTSEELHGRTIIDPVRNRIRYLQHDDSPYEVPVAAVFVDACAGNYAHWMTEVLPRIVLFCADERFDGVPVVVNDGLHRNIMASLQFVVGVRREIITLPVGRALAVKKLYLTSMAGYVPFERRGRDMDNHSHGLFSPDALKALGRHLNAKIEGTQGRAWPEKIFLRRNSGTRKIVNSAQIERLLAMCGFATVEPEILSFPEQVQLFRNAKAVIGPTGAAFASAICCRPGTQITILMSRHEDMIYRYWCNMLAPLGLHVNYVLGDIVDNKHLGLHGDFEVNPADVLALLEATGHANVDEGVTQERASVQQSIGEDADNPASPIHPLAQVSQKARLGRGVEIGPFSIIHGNVILGDRVKVGAYCELGIPTSLGDGSPLVIGDDALIRSHSVFYESSSFGTGLVTGHHVTVRENTIAGTAFQIGTLCEIQGDCFIGDHVRFQSNVFVGKKTFIGNFVWVLPYVVLTNDPTPPSNHLIGCRIEDFATVAAAAVVLPGIKVGHHALVAAQACVTKDVPPHMVAAGAPASVVKETKEVMLRDGTGRPAYPWTRHFTRGYPEDVVAEWMQENMGGK